MCREQKRAKEIDSKNQRFKRKRKTYCTHTRA